MKLLKLIPAALLLSTAVHAAPTAWSSANVLTWPNSKIMTPVTLQSHHQVTITNDGEYKIFYFKFTLCPLDQMSRCIVQQENMGLAKGQTYTRKIDLTGSVIFQAVGSHPIYAKTEITGGGLSTTEDQKQLWVYY